MFSVGLDEFESLILYSQLIAAKIVNNKPFISRFHFSSLAPEPKDNFGSGSYFYSLLPPSEQKQRKKKNKNKSKSGEEEVKEIIFGSLLGDAKIEMPPRGINARFGFTQSLDKKEYFLSVLNSLGEICSGKYREMSYLDQRTGKTYTNLNF